MGFIVFVKKVMFVDMVWSISSQRHVGRKGGNVWFSR